MREDGFEEGKSYSSFLANRYGGREVERFGTVNSYPLTAWDAFLEVLV